MSSSCLLKLEGIKKSFGGIHALRGVDLEVNEGEIHAIVGENGAGKSTLMKILARELREDAGEIILQGESLVGLSPWEVQARGMRVVHQELNVIPSLSVRKNILLGCPPTKSFGLLSWRKGYAKAEEALRLVSSSLRLEDKVSTLGAAGHQLVILARALVHQPRILILDEPTARLGMEETNQLFFMLEKLKNNKVTIIYISHRLEEIYRICDRVTVLRDGNKVITTETCNLPEEQLVHHMIGRELTNFIPKKKVQLGDVVVEAKGISFGTKVKEASFTVRGGEVVGLVGAVGAGKSELLHVLFGADVPDKGEIIIGGKRNLISKPADAIKSKIALIPEDRTNQGLVRDFAVKENLTLVYPEASGAGIIKLSKERETVANLIKQLQINPPNPYSDVKTLSGGNQQKVVLGKWLLTKQKVYLFDEVTAGIDVGAKTEIYKLIGDLAAEGAAILVSTSDITEALGLCGRLMVMHRGRIVAELPGESTGREEVLTCMMGGGLK
ncbi:MAG: sugar ABC transporter ATP-binding protein [Bacillota bacterium]